MATQQAGPCAENKEPWMLQVRASKIFILATVCLAIFCDAFIYGVVVPVIPFYLRDTLGVPERDVQWWTSVLLAIFAFFVLLGSPFCGWYADHYHNRQVPYYLGLFVLALATILFGFATNVWILLMSRMLQGLSSAIVYTIGLAILVETVGRDEIGQWMGTALSSSSFGLIVSPVLGGIVYETAGSFYVLAMSIGLIVLDVILRIAMIDKKTAANYHKKFPAVSETPRLYGTFENDHRTKMWIQNEGRLTLGLLGSLDGSNENDSDDQSNANSTDEGSSMPASSGSSRRRGRTQSTSSTLGSGETGIDKKQSKLPPILTLFASPRVLAATYGVFVNVSVLASFDGVLPNFVKRTFEWTSLQTGLIFLAIAIPALLGPLAGQLSDCFGPKPIATLGCILTTPSLILLQFVTHNSEDQIILLCGLLILIGCTLILIISPLAADLSFVVEQEEREHPGKFGESGAYCQAYALFNCSLATATIFGPLFAGWLVESYGWTTMAWGMGAFCLSGAIPCILYTGGHLMGRGHL